MFETIKARKFREINFYIRKDYMTFGLLLGEEEYPLSDGETFSKKHILKDPRSVLPRKHVVEAVDYMKKHTVPITINNVTIPLKANIYWDMVGLWPPEKETEMHMLREECRRLKMIIAQEKVITSTLMNESRAFKAEVERLKQEKTKRDLHYQPHQVDEQ